MYSKEQILEYLNNQKSIRDAINNIYALGKKLPYIYDNDTNCILFYFDKNIINTQKKLIDKIHKYMRQEAWEKADYCKIMDLKEILSYFNLKINKNED